VRRNFVGEAVTDAEEKRESSAQGEVCDGHPGGIGT
jgi:hypothetical protein